MDIEGFVNWCVKSGYTPATVRTYKWGLEQSSDNMTDSAKNVIRSAKRAYKKYEADRQEVVSAVQELPTDLQLAITVLKRYNDTQQRTIILVVDNNVIIK